MTGKIGTGLRPFVAECMANPFSGYAARFEALWKAAADLEAFKKAVLADDVLKLSQGYAELSKDCEGHWHRVREMFGERTFRTVSDAGSVRVFMENGFAILIGNGYGDGYTRVAVFEGDDAKNFNDNMMRYTGTDVVGSCSISASDCEDITTKFLDGSYRVYAYEGLVAFVEY
jgi:hypothetical protein